MTRRILFVALLFATIIATPTSALADKVTAQEHFAKAQSAFDKHDYRLAAKEFEEAYRAEPHHSPLWNAARSWARAGESVRAANLYVKYLREAPAGTKDRDTATQSLAELATKLGKIVVHGVNVINLRIDDAIADPDGVFVPPGEHTVSGSASSGGAEVRKSVKIGEGETRSVTLEPPKKDDGAPGPPPPPPLAPRPPESFHVPWFVPVIGGALTLAAGGLTVWSGLDTNSQRSKFDDDLKSNRATQTQIDDGKDAQLRTNIFLGVTAGLGILTGVSLLFVDWNVGGSVTSNQATLTIGRRL
jgi:hypothetical protein